MCNTHIITNINTREYPLGFIMVHMLQMLIVYVLYTKIFHPLSTLLEPSAERIDKQGVITICISIVLE